ncbi:MAG: 1-acyl-sn-glycerol-3-phosphate acyltransferase [Gammaproteobacteria bacterium]|nr:1-acyl-sn-glycerol-3-phosphate acyltransferase [Gammaproteobacteria bacterium]
MFNFVFRLIKMTALWLDFILLTTVMYLAAWLPSNFHGKLYFHMFQKWSRSFVRALDVNLKIHQKNLYPIPEQYILIANHPSAFEDIGIAACFKVHSLAKIEVKKWWIVGKISEAAGTLYVQRESKESRNQALETMMEELKSGKSIALYPEGGCKGRRIFESFRYGAFDVAMRTGIPVLPVFLHYESQDDFEWRDPQTLIEKLYHFMTSQNRTANYYVYDAIDPAQFNSKEEFTEYTWHLYKKWQEKYLE